MHLRCVFLLKSLLFSVILIKNSTVVSKESNCKHQKLQLLFTNQWEKKILCNN